jgi:hypothetical protein
MPDLKEAPEMVQIRIQRPVVRRPRGDDLDLRTPSGRLLPF